MHRDCGEGEGQAVYSVEGTTSQLKTGCQNIYYAAGRGLTLRVMARGVGTLHVAKRGEPAESVVLRAEGRDVSKACMRAR